MVCLFSGGTVMATIRDTTSISGVRKSSNIALSPSTRVSTIFQAVATDFNYSASSVEVVIQNSINSTILNPHPDKTLEEIGVTIEVGILNVILIKPAKTPKSMTLLVSDTLEDDLILGASASPTTGETPSSSTEVPGIEYTCTLIDYHKQNMQDGGNYIGLVNQAMTCYLNSLLQALFMTPEFRNALYNWEFKGSKEEKSIPYQLQRLFLNLQTSSKSAVETTELTRSFGWDLSEAWQQHDVQELCRVMFDALEVKFKETQQANFINDLYQGKMLDYVKCLECGTDNSREDTFLDIPLPVRPFGSTTAYNSVEEALRAFVQPETLEGNNQYHCDKCKKKCDAHKGFKFIKFPYVLTLHLKRFDFDYTTMHRIKLNDKVVFPEFLNLNSLITCGNGVTDHESNDERETIVKCDDCSTTDSGSALDDENCQFNDVASAAGHCDTCQDDDEGIDVSIGSHHHENENNHQQDVDGPYKYELFSIMIHAGSASGGHYYANIKDFQRKQWYCFNDQTVTPASEEDIRKTYGGGGPTRPYYSNAYSTSTNAYMLMYRQIDKERNCSVMKVEEFPLHIKTLLHEMREKEEHERAFREHDRDTLRLVVYCWHPIQNQFVDKKLYVTPDTTLQEAAEKAYQRFQLTGIVDIADCRLVAYNKDQECIECSFEDSNMTFSDIPNKMHNIGIDWQLQIKHKGKEFPVYKVGGVNMKLFFINLDTEEVEGPHNFHVNVDDTVLDIKCRIAKMLRMDCNTIKLVQESYNNDMQYLIDDDPVIFDSNYRGYKLYAAEAIDVDPNNPFCMNKLIKVIDCFVHVIIIEVSLPEVDSSVLENLSIPPLDMNQNVDKNDLASGDRLRISPQPISGNLSEGFGDQSNSEDSSLSDGDRTLVGDAPGDCAVLSSNSNSPADQHMASPSDPTEDSYNHDVFGNPGEEMNWDDDTTDVPQRLPNYYFRVVNRLPYYIDNSSNSCILVQVDKRISLNKFKKNLEPLVGVPIEYFKVFKQSSPDSELTSSHEVLHWAKDNEKLVVKLGRVLKDGEFSGKVFHLTLENTELFKYLFDWVIAKGQTVGQVKRDILAAAKKRHSLDITFNKSRLRAKDWKVPSKVYLDDQKFEEDIAIGSNWEMFLQDLGEGEKVTNINQLCLFVKRWCPSTLTLTPFHEVVLNSKTVDELKNKLSEVSDIPQEYIEVALLNSAFPGDINILEIQDLDWNVNGSHLENWPLQVHVDGKIFLYRDNREKLKELTPEERKEINARESKRLGKRIPKATYANRKERALKIYIDSSPKKSDGIFVD